MTAPKGPVTPLKPPVTSSVLVATPTSSLSSPTTRLAPVLTLTSRTTPQVTTSASYYSQHFTKACRRLSVSRRQPISEPTCVQLPFKETFYSRLYFSCLCVTLKSPNLTLSHLVGLIYWPEGFLTTDSKAPAIVLSLKASQCCRATCHKMP